MSGGTASVISQQASKGEEGREASDLRRHLKMHSGEKSVFSQGGGREREVKFRRLVKRL